MSTDKDNDKKLSVPFLKIKHPRLILKFSAEWCGPCKDAVMLNDLHTLSKRYAYHIEEINVDEYTELCEEYSVNSVPTFVIFDDTSENTTIVGGNIKAMEQWIMRNKMSDN